MRLSNLTKEQQLAVDKDKTNIIVSAGAGSGKTTVLKTRVARILQSGVGINNLIILTFTNNAAAEMKERIRKIINEDKTISDQALLLDSAYITTFDSFAQSLVKKYNYLLGISKDFTIVDSSIINLEIERCIDEIFENLYYKRDENFIKLVSDIEVKNDKQIREMIGTYYKQLMNLIDRKRYLEDYIETYFSDDFVNKMIDKLENILFDLRDKILTLLEDLESETLNEGARDKNQVLYANLSSASSLDDLYYLDNLALARAYKGYYTDEATIIREQIKSLLDELKKYLVDDKEKVIEHYLSTRPYIEAIIKILLELDREVNDFKKSHNVYEFSDIALKAIELVKNNADVRNEIKEKTYEIMIDEYQDTNDIQEEFISYIANNNVYMVGDVKQSIYRFRNANPHIFKKKYDDYSKDKNGFKIDLNMNFRSRNEVINNINLIFDLIMYDDVGGADYKNQHEMIFGNKNYLNFQNHDYDMEIISYDNSEKKYNDKEIEAFLIADDINRRLANKETITDFQNGAMIARALEYRDFSVLVDKSTNFELIKKILEYRGIPTTIYKDISIKDEDEVYILKNLITLIIGVKKERLDNEFKHAFLSIARSYVCQMRDNDVYNIFVNDGFRECELYKKVLELSVAVDNHSNKEILALIIDKMEIVEKLVIVGDVEERLTKLEYFVKNAESLNNFGYSIYQLRDYFDEILKSDEDIKMTTNKDSRSNTVKIMTIHASKGLEYPIVYLPYLKNNFIKDPKVTRFKFSPTLGFVVPFYDNGIGKTLAYDLYNNEENIQKLSERIRLFYVALTRAKEKIIMINEFNEDISPSANINTHDLVSLTNFRDILSVIKYKISKYIKQVNLNDISIDNGYNLIKDSNYKERIRKSDAVIDVRPLTHEYKILDNKHFSKSLTKIIDKDLKTKLDFGTYMHYVFEVYDFNNDNLEELNINDKAKNHVKNFLKHPEVLNIKTANCFKEYEIRFIKDGAIYHGFIDLLLEFRDHYVIIDYKLSDIDKSEYKLQLKGYKEYIETKFKKPCQIFLYSINKDIFKEIV